MNPPSGTGQRRIRPSRGPRRPRDSALRRYGPSYPAVSITVPSSSLTRRLRHRSSVASSGPPRPHRHSVRRATTMFWLRRITSGSRTGFPSGAAIWFTMSLSTVYVRTLQIGDDRSCPSIFTVLKTSPSWPRVPKNRGLGQRMTVCPQTSWSRVRAAHDGCRVDRGCRSSRSTWRS